MNSLRIGSRGSKLALWQAHHISARLAEMGCKSEIVVIKTSGDRFQQAQIAQIGMKGVFIKEIEDALLAGEVDIAVHSMKDVPTDQPEGLDFPAICQREDARDALISRRGKDLKNLPARARIGTSSLRRQSQIRRARPDVEVVELRGNVDTRLAKLDRGDYDAIVLAKAGLDRLGWSNRITQVLPPEICLPAVGQGALGVESRSADKEILALLQKLNHNETRIGITAERTVLEAMQGGCQLPLGAWGRLENGTLTLDACVLSADGTECLRSHADANDGDPIGLGRKVADDLLARGAKRLLELAGRKSAAE